MDPTAATAFLPDFAFSTNTGKYNVRYIFTFENLIRKNASEIRHWVEPR